MNSAIERRQLILEALNDRRTDTYERLAVEFNVSKRTIQNDISILSCSTPIFTVAGNGGGVHVADGWYLSRRYLREDQEALLKKLLAQLPADDKITMLSILASFAKPCNKG